MSWRVLLVAAIVGITFAPPVEVAAQERELAGGLVLGVGAVDAALGVLPLVLASPARCTTWEGSTCRASSDDGAAMRGWAAGGAFVGAALDVLFGALIFSSPPNDARTHWQLAGLGLGLSLVSQGLGLLIGGSWTAAQAPANGTCITTLDGACSESQTSGRVAGAHALIGVGAGLAVLGGVLTGVLFAVAPSGGDAHAALVPRLSVGANETAVGLDLSGRF